MLNNFDRQLILALQQDGRATNIELAKRLQVHVSTVAKRIEALEKNEIMKIRALPNPSKLGYHAHAFIAIEASSLKSDEICARLTRNFHVNLLATTFGRYDIVAIAYAPTWEKLFSVVSNEISSIDGIKVDTYLVKDVKKRYYGFPVVNMEPVKIDEVDEAIIEKLTENGRYKSQHLAGELGLSPPTCLRRISRLLAERVIEIKSVPNPSKIGYASNAFMFLQVQANRLETICSTLHRHRDIFLIMTLINSYNVFISFNATSPEELYRLKNEILSIEGVIHAEIIIRAEIKKRYYGGFLD